MKDILWWGRLILGVTLRSTHVLQEHSTFRFGQPVKSQIIRVINAILGSCDSPYTHSYHNNDRRTLVAALTASDGQIEVINSNVSSAHGRGPHHFSVYWLAVLHLLGFLRVAGVGFNAYHYLTVITTIRMMRCS